MGVLRRVCIKATMERELLSAGKVFLQLKSNLGEEFWLHIALMYFNPQRPTYHCMAKIGNPEPHIHHSEERQFLQALGE
eukprot:2754805-Amphidinium_carterae.1